MEPCSGQYDNTIYDEQMLQINELDEWRTHVKEKLKKHDKEPKRGHDKHVDGANKFNVGDKVLLDKTDPRIATSELDLNGSNPFTALNGFSYGTIEVTHSEFGTVKVNSTRLKLYFDNRIVNKKEEFRQEEFRLREPP
ncbi:hypothetical protein GOBAR_DD30317 [Gossypium barbadense]|nr:hypothetical protein GOBAR_DD30317 [Gossypium barbadense]